MEILGTVVEILGNRMILISPEPTAHIYKDETFNVFAEINNDGLLKYGLSSLHIPKGEVRIIAIQTNGFLLAEAFQTTFIQERVIPKQTSILSSILGSETDPETVRETVPGPFSAKIGAPTIPVEYSRVVQVGDKVGK